jgi:ribonuclease P protein component
MEENYWQEEGPGAGRNLPFQTRSALSNTAVKPFTAVELGGLKSQLTLNANERLKSKKLTDILFSEGKSVTVNGFTLVYLFKALPAPYPVQAGFSVPKRHFKHAVDRNRIKRLMREAWRHIKHPFYLKLAEKNLQLACMWVYKGKEVPDFETVKTNLAAVLNKMKV